MFPKAAPVPSSVLSGQRQHKKTRIDIIQAGVYDSNDKMIHPVRPPPVQLPYPRYVQIIDLSCPSVKKKCGLGRENMRGNPLRRLDIPLEIGYHWMASHSFAAVVESADTRDLKSLAGNGVRVQVPPAAPDLRSAIRNELPATFLSCGSTISRVHFVSPLHVGMDYAPFKIPSHPAGDFSYRSVVPPLRQKSRRAFAVPFPRVQDG